MDEENYDSESSDFAQEQAFPDDDYNMENSEDREVAEFFGKVREEAKKIGPVVTSKKNFDCSVTQTAYIHFSPIREYFIKGHYDIRIGKDFKHQVITRFITLKNIIEAQREKKRNSREPFALEPNFILRMKINSSNNLPEAIPIYEELVNVSEVVLHNTVGSLLKKLKKVKGVPYEFGIWIFAMLLLLEKPLLPDVGGELNDLMGYIITEQTALLEKDPIHTIHTTINLLIVIIAEYFGQRC